MGAVEAMSARSKAVQQTQRVSTGAVSANGTLSSRARAAAVGQADAADKKKPADKLEAVAPAPLPQLTSKEPALVLPAPELTQVLTPQAQRAFEPLMPQMVEDASLRVALMPHTARVSLETPESGRVSVQVKVTDGVAEMHASGPAAPALDLRQNELRVALAQQGLSLGQFDLTQSGGGQGGNQREERAERAETSSTRSTRSSSSSSSSEAIAGDGRVHVKA
jgi:hypothetical protein